MKEWIKVWWHCLIHFFPLSNSHRFVTLQWSDGRRDHFCECGYLNPSEPSGYVNFRKPGEGE